MVLIRNKLNSAIQNTVSDPSERFSILKVALGDKFYVLINIYVPNKDKLTCEFFKNLMADRKSRLQGKYY